MGRAPCCDKANVKKGPWSPEEDSKLKEFIEKYGTGGNWIALPQKAGLKRCGKSCRLRWLNYLRPNIKHGEFSEEEDRIICTLFATIGSRWSIIAAQLPGRTDNDIKNYWNTKLKKKLLGLAPLKSQTKDNPPPPLQVQTASHPPLPSLPISLLSPPPPLYREYCSSYSNPTRSLSGLDPTSVPPNPMNNNYDNYNFTPSLSTPNCSLLQTHESLFSFLQYYPPVVKDNILVFGGDQPSCSSSDGSCSQTQISHGREIKQEDMGLQSYLQGNGFEENQRLLLDYGSNFRGEEDLCTWTDQKPNGYYFGNSTASPLEYEVEEVKKMISNSTTTNNNWGNSLFFNDENKTLERTMCCYYY